MSNDPNDNLPSASWETSPRARKARKCYECRGEIRVGARYRGFAGIWDGSFEHFTLCMRCARLHDYMRSIDLSCCFGEAGEAIHEAGLGSWFKAMKARGGFQYDKDSTASPQPVVEGSESASS